MSDEQIEEAPVVETDKPPADKTDWEQQYKELHPEFTRKSQILTDQEKWLAHGQEHFPDVFDEPEPEPKETVDDDEYDEPEYLTVEQYEQREAERQAAQVAEKEQQRFETDFKRFVGDRELDQYGEAALRAGSYKAPEDLEQAINGYFEYVDSLRGGKPKRKTTPPLAGGKTATGVPDYSEMSRDQQNEVMAERARALLS